jgi:hypothetical protein
MSALFLGPCFERMAPKAVDGDDAVELISSTRVSNFRGEIVHSIR